MGDTDFVPAPLLDWFTPVSERAVMHAQRLQAEGEPGVMNDRGQLLLHRSHLPLVERVTVAAGAAPPPAITWPHNFEPRPWQMESAEFFSRRGGGILALEPRMGKTAVPFMLWDGTGQLLIVGPLALRSVWREWAARMYPDVPFRALEGHSYDPEAKHAPIIFVHYDILNHWMGAFANRPSLAVFDEPHVLAGYKADRTQTCKMVRGMCQRAIVLTGTPLWSKPKELHNVLQVACGVGFGHNFRDWGLKYCGGKPGKYAMDYSGVSNTERLRARLAEVVHVRSWNDVGMPPDIRRTITKVPITEEIADKLDAEMAELRAGKDAIKAGDLARYRRLISKIKAQAVIESVGKNPTEPIVIWTWHRQTCEMLAKELGALHIHGGMTDAARIKILDTWRDLSGPPMLISTIPVAQVGIDLSRAARELFCEVDYTPSVVSQAEMRPFKPGRPLDVEFFTADHVVDDQMTAALSRKLDAARAIGLPGGEHSVADLVAAGEAASEAPDMDALAAALLEDD